MLRNTTFFPHILSAIIQSHLLIHNIVYLPDSCIQTNLQFKCIYFIFSFFENETHDPARILLGCIALFHFISKNPSAE